MDWRKWLEEMEERAQLLEREAYTVPDAVESRCMVHSHSLPRLFEGYRLLAEAVEAERALREHQAQCDWAQIDKPGACLDGSCTRLEAARDKAYEAALAQLRGVGRD